MAARDEPHSRVLDELELLYVGRFAVWEPDGCRVAHDRFDECLVRDEQSLAVMAPRGATDCLQEV